MVNKEELISFETEIGNLFNEGKIKAPIHLYSGNEDEMIEVFKDIDIENDWVCCTWRNHYQGLLKDIPQEVLKERIMNGKSMVMNLPEYKFICSSIVGGIPSIAAGIAIASSPLLLGILGDNFGISRAYIMVPVLIAGCLTMVLLSSSKHLGANNI